MDKDVGAPVFDRDGVVLGMVIYTTTERNPKMYTAYIRLSEYSDWIEEAIKDMEVRNYMPGKVYRISPTHPRRYFFPETTFEC